MAPPVAARACQGEWGKEIGWVVELAEEEVVEIVAVANEVVSVGEGVLTIATGGDRRSVVEEILGMGDDDDKACGPCSLIGVSSESWAQWTDDGEGVSCIL